MPSEYKLVLRHVDEAGYTNDIKCYQKHGGYKTMKKVFKLKAKLFYTSISKHQSSSMRRVRRGEDQASLSRI